MAEKTILSIDCGTQSIRALIFALDGRLLAKEQVTYAPYDAPAPGIAEQDPEIYWNGLVQACRVLSKKEPSLFSAVAGMG